MTSKSGMSLAVLMTVLGLMTTACERERAPERGPLERAGHDIDREARRAGHDIDMAADEAGEAVDEAAEDIDESTDMH
ncbi:MAG: hypothetical protein J0L92_00775 [Deltaproteobacteria bacterium]|nr:hypothetical protein [Deltaproteobacteria bacterium]